MFVLDSDWLKDASFSRKFVVRSQAFRIAAGDFSHMEAEGSQGAGRFLFDVIVGLLKTPLPVFDFPWHLTVHTNKHTQSLNLSHTHIYCHVLLSFPPTQPLVCQCRSRCKLILNPYEALFLSAHMSADQIIVQETYSFINLLTVMAECCIWNANYFLKKSQPSPALINVNAFLCFDRNLGKSGLRVSCLGLGKSLSLNWGLCCSKKSVWWMSGQNVKPRSLDIWRNNVVLS